MEFKDILNKYCVEIGCTISELSEASGLSKSLISRYKCGERIPQKDGESLKKLAKGIYLLSSNDHKVTSNNIYNELRNLLVHAQISKEDKSLNFACNFDYTMNLLKIPNNEMARVFNVDTSFISRIRNKKRLVNNVEELSIQYSKRIYNKYFNSNKSMLLKMLGKDENELISQSEFVDFFSKWMIDKRINDNPITSFLNKLDEFDLNNYIKAINFDTIKVPTSPITFPTSKKYYGIEEMREGTIDFLKGTVLSKKNDEVTISSDMPMEGLSKDVQFCKRWMQGLALIIKKGINMNVIHCLDRPFHELMLGLESWIPLYMTGQISPYYFTVPNNNVFCHLNFTSGTCALYGECISGYDDEGMYYLTKKRNEVKYYLRKNKRALEKAKPLMRIYRSEHSEEYNNFFNKINVMNISRKNIYSSLPLYTLSNSLLKEIVYNSNLSKKERLNACNAVKKYCDQVVLLLDKNIIVDDISIIEYEEFEKKPVTLPLSVLGLEYNICYTWEQYKKHIEAIKIFKNNHKNYQYYIHKEHIFKNIDILCLKNNVSLITKNNNPIINFVVEYPKLREAIENMVFTVNK